MAARKAKSNGHSNGNGRPNGSASGKANATSNGRSNGKSNGKSNGNGHRAKANGDRVVTERAQSPRGRPTRGAESHPTVRPKGTLVIIGGHEDKEGDRLILRLLADRVGSGKLVVASIASDLPKAMW